MAQTTGAFARAMDAEIQQWHLDLQREFLLMQEWFNPELREERKAREAWDDAIRWLEEREDADAEWPWPKWGDRHGTSSVR